MLPTSAIEFDMPIWRVLPFSDSPHLAIELRDADRLIARFATISVTEGTLELGPVAGPADWWVGLQAAGLGHLYLHEFGQQPQVGVSGLAAVNATSGQVTWQRSGYSFAGLGGTAILAQKLNSANVKPQPLLPHTGLNAENEAHLNGSAAAWAPPASCFPAAYLPDNPHYATLSEFLELKLGFPVQGPIEYLEGDRHIIFSIHARQQEALANYLLIFANNGHLRFRRCLAKELTGFAADTFFVFQGKTVAIQDRKRLLLIDCEN